MRRKVAATLLLGALVVALTGCGEPTTVAGIREQAKIVSNCHAAGGVWLSNQFGGYACYFDDDLKGD